MNRTLLYNARIVPGGDARSFHGWILIEDGLVADMGPYPVPESLFPGMQTSIDCCKAWLLPGVVDTHVHFRDPGLTHKGDMASESRAALAGGVTTVLDMPNTKPPTLTVAAIDAKMARAAEVCEVNYGFFIGAAADNIEEVLRADYSRIPGVKLFLGSSTGNMLLDSEEKLEELFAKVPAPIAVHAEDEAMIRSARERIVAECAPAGVPVERHPDMRPREACIEATRRTLALARKTGARVHICHISTADELQLIAEAKADGVRVTAETCPQYLLFDRTDFGRLGSRIKCNPSVKEPSDRVALLRAILPGGVIDTIATDHAPHLLSEKEGDALTAASGMPMVQFSLVAMLTLMASEPELEGMTMERLVDLMATRPAEIFGMEGRGSLRRGQKADLTVVDMPGASAAAKVTDADVISLCGWTPLAGMALDARVRLTMVGGVVGYRDGLFFHPDPEGVRFTDRKSDKQSK